MFRPALSFLIALSALLASTTLAAKTSVSSLQQPELPCPANRGDAIESGASAAGANAPASATPVISRGANKAARQRWKALLPGTLKSAT